MYQIKPESILTFIKDNSIRFPRFQRKQTWKDDQNMKLVISVFKSYPIGVTIVNKEEENGLHTRWLLDGRQRRNALMLMYEDPENIYRWTYYFCKLSSADPKEEVKRKFWAAIDAYLNKDKEGSEEADEAADGQQDAWEDTQSASTSEDRSAYGYLNELLEIVLCVHKQTKKHSGFTKPFDFLKVVKRLPYYDSEQERFCGKRLTQFIRGYREFVPSYQGFSPESFLAYVLDRLNFSAQDKEAASLKVIIQNTWSDIMGSFRCVELLEARIQASVIGIIETHDISSPDSQMIFTLINDAGTKLSAVEILSAKPAWNRQVKVQNEELSGHIKALYESIKAQADSTVVRWDYPATLFGRVENLSVLVPKVSYEEKADKTITLGFKVLSGIYQKSINKKSISELADNPNIDWETDIDQVIADLSAIGALLEQMPYFRALKSWNQHFMTMCSDAVAINMMLLLLEDYRAKDIRHTTLNTKIEAFQLNALKLADKMVYEYITRKWKGSSDSMIANNLKDFGPATFERVTDGQWRHLIEEINKDNKILEDPIKKLTVMKPLVYHIYCMCGISSHLDGAKSDIELVLGKDLFRGEHANRCYSLFNLYPAPQQEEGRKVSKPITELRRQTDASAIYNLEQYAHISYEDFTRYGAANGWFNLQNDRAYWFLDKFIRSRAHALADRVRY